MKNYEFQNSEVKNIFNNYPSDIRNRLLFLRQLIFQLAEESEYIGDIEETLKWGNPSYLTRKPKSGTTIRLSNHSNNHKYAVSIHCQTTLISEFKEIYSDIECDGNRSIIFNTDDNLPIEVVKHFIYLALTYHYRKKHAIGI